eukprot:1856869-Pleurochrysis_carterae.AAC.1
MNHAEDLGFFTILNLCLDFCAQGLSAFDNFGASVTALHDLDWDGVPELLVGATGDTVYPVEGLDPLLKNDGAAYVVFLGQEGN